MKFLILLPLILALTMGLSACGSPIEPDETDATATTAAPVTELRPKPEDMLDWAGVETIEVTSSQCPVPWTLTDQEEILALKNWFLQLSLVKEEFEAHEDPGSVDGGYYTAFVLGEGAGAFTYRIGLEAGTYYIAHESNWYRVVTPSFPPVSPPEV
ncbi:MAG: hypothetical protein LIO46_04820 [Clostridiales bacterium]|nr:hypothetical protein [Clostridiales bacterium]